mmetsp:Transcript_15276/g.20153  ORF Transcript_15276/g.20153 Transcript_15276/m.20153 type:complete len:92 (-) Transcript_15276:128-403(-)
MIKHCKSTKIIYEKEKIGLGARPNPFILKNTLKRCMVLLLQIIACCFKDFSGFPSLHMQRKKFDNEGNGMMQSASQLLQALLVTCCTKFHI